MADGGVSIAANTVQGRMERAISRSSEMTEVKQEDKDGEVADDERVDDEDQKGSHEEDEGVWEGYDENDQGDESDVDIKQEE